MHMEDRVRERERERYGIPILNGQRVGSCGSSSSSFAPWGYTSDKILTTFWGNRAVRPSLDMIWWCCMKTVVFSWYVYPNRLLCFHGCPLWLESKSPRILHHRSSTYSTHHSGGAVGSVGRQQTHHGGTVELDKTGWFLRPWWEIQGESWLLKPPSRSTCLKKGQGMWVDPAWGAVNGFKVWVLERSHVE